MATADTQVIIDGQRATAVALQNGDMIYSGGSTDTQCIVNVKGTPQRAHKVALVGPGASAKPKYVPELPEVGEEGVLYLVPTDYTRDGYQIFEEFVYISGEWAGIGAYDVGIQAGGMVYERSFDTSTNTWVVTVNQVS